MDGTLVICVVIFAVFLIGIYCGRCDRVVVCVKLEGGLVEEVMADRLNVHVEVIDFDLDPMVFEDDTDEYQDKINRWAWYKEKFKSVYV